MLYDKDVPDTNTVPAALTIAVDHIEGSCERTDATKGKTYGAAAFEALLAEVAADAPAGGAYDKAAVKLTRKAGRCSSIAPRGEEISLDMRLDVTRDFGTLRAALVYRARQYRSVALTGRTPDGDVCGWLTADQADDAANNYEEALNAYDACVAVANVA